MERELKASDHIVPQSAEFYVKTAIGRALHSTMEQLDMLEWVANHAEASESHKDQARGLHRHSVQWFKEAVVEFKNLDPELVPDLRWLNTDKVQYLPPRS